MPRTSASPVDRHLDLGVLDALRGFAALYVVLFHTTLYLWAHGAGLTASTGSPVGDLLARGWLGLMNYGQEAVLLFFVLSGFCIHFRQAKRSMAEPGSTPSLDIRNFAWRRFRRLYPVLVAAIVVTAAFDYLGGMINPSMYNGTALHPFAKDLVDLSYSVPTLIGNLLFQSTLVVPAFGTNHPLWSLAFEFWFYALYPVFVALSGRIGSPRMLVFATLVSLLALAITRLTSIALPYWIGAILAHWAIWVAGAVVAEIYVGRVRFTRYRWLGVGSGLALVGLVVGRPGGGAGIASWQDLAWGLTMGALLTWMMAVSPSRRPGRAIEAVARFFAPLGAISYSLYVMHFPFVVLLTAWWLSGHAAMPLGIELQAVGIVSSIALGAGCWWAVERHFLSVRASDTRRAPTRVVQELVTGKRSAVA